MLACVCTVDYILFVSKWSFNCGSVKKKKRQSLQCALSHKVQMFLNGLQMNMLHQTLIQHVG